MLAVTHVRDNDRKIELPSCEYRKDIGGYYNTCLT